MQNLFHMLMRGCAAGCAALLALVLAGCAILEAILRFWPAERLRVADRGLREGILTTLMMEDGVWRAGRRRRRGSHNAGGHNQGRSG